MMNELKTKYMERVRKETAYPNARHALEILFYLSILVAGIWLLVLFHSVGQKNAILFLLYSLLTAITGYLFRELGLAILDIADSVTDLNSRYEGQ
jgi:hypothetical protein